MAYFNIKIMFISGLERVHRLLSGSSYELRVDLEDFYGITAFAIYPSFQLGDATTGYTLSLGTIAGGNACTYCFIHTRFLLTE